MKKSTHTSYHTIQFHETDMAGFAHFPHVFHWAEQAELEFMQAIGVKLIETQGGITNVWPRVHIEATYLQPLRFEDTIALCISIQSIGTYSIAYHIDIFNLESNAWALASRVDMKTVYATREGVGLLIKKAPIPQTILEKITVASSLPTPPLPNKEV